MSQHEIGSIKAITVTAYTTEAFDEQGNYNNASQTIFSSLGNALAPNTVPKLSQQQ